MYEIRNTVWESSHIYFFCGGNPFVCIRATAGEHTWHVCLSDLQVSPFTWETSGPLPFAWETKRPLPSPERRADLSPSLEKPVDLYLWLRNQRASPFAWETSGPLPSLERSADLSSSLERPVDLSPSLQRPVDLCFQSKITDLILSLKSHAEIWTSSSPHVFLFMTGYWNVHTSVVFSGNLLIFSGNWNICHSIHRQ